jgi:hypothetical protein
VVAIESDREFALSVLQRIDEELKRRGEMYRKLGAQDLAGYKRAGGTEPMPRSLLIIDEFQEFFVEDDSVAQGAALLLDRIVRQGRAFGIHVFLGSQTLGGAYTLARTTWGRWSSASPSSATRPMRRSSWMTRTPRRVCSPVPVKASTTTPPVRWKGTAPSRSSGSPTKNAMRTSSKSPAGPRARLRHETPDRL